MLSFIKTASYNFRRMIRKSEVVLVTMLPNLFRRHKISYIKIDTLLSNSIKKIFIWNNHVSNILQCPANTVIGDLVPIHLIFIPRYCDCSSLDQLTFVLVTGSARRRALNVVSDIVWKVFT